MLWTPNPDSLLYVETWYMQCQVKKTLNFDIYVEMKNFEIDLNLCHVHDSWEIKQVLMYRIGLWLTHDFKKKKTSYNKCFPEISLYCIEGKNIDEKKCFECHLQLLN